MDTWRSDNGDEIDGDVIEIIPIEEYDVQKAKVKASLSWILYKAYQDKVPTEFHDPFYITGEGSWQIKPRLANLLASSELYCQACRYMFGENASQWTGHWSIIQVLSRKGIYAVGTDSVDVTESILMHSAPFKIKAHLALIDALMLAFSREIVTIERVTQAVRKFASFNASSELPTDTEDAILFWVNKVCVTVQHHLDKCQETMIEGGETSQKVRIVSNKTPRDSISVPIMETLVGDMGDGCSIATLISFYCPQILKIEDVCLKSNVGIADSLYNLRLIRSFCDRHLPYKTCHLTFEDLLYTHQSVRDNIIIMMAEMFYWFEMKPPPIVTGGTIAKMSEYSNAGERPNTAINLQSSSATKVPNIPISHVTKQSFQRMKGDSELRSSSTPDVHKMSPSAPIPPRMPLLYKRQQHGQIQDDHGIKDSRHGVQRTSSLTAHDIRTSAGVPRQSTLAWPEKSPVSFDPPTALPETDRSGMSSNLLSNVSIDSEMNASFSSGSIDLGDLDASPRPNTDRSHFDNTEAQNTIQFSLQNKQTTSKQKTPYPEHIEVDSVNSGMDFRVSQNEIDTGVTCVDQSFKGDNLEPLMPARLKPAKEKTNNHTKEQERDETPKRKTPSPPKLKKRVLIDPQLGRSGNNDISDEYVTPLPDEMETPRYHSDFGAGDQQQEGLTQKHFDAFFVRGSVADSQELLTNRSDVTVAESYTIDQMRTPEAARAAGIPVIDEGADILSGRRLSREGSVASSKSSGDFSDHESHKIHFDHKTRETSNKNNNRIESLNNLNQTDLSDPRRFIMQKPVLVTRQPTKECDTSGKGGGLSTNFAQIRQMKQFGQVDHTGLVFMQHGKDDEEKRSSLKDAFQKSKSEKKTSFAPLPNQTTWQQSSNGGSANQIGASASGVSSTEIGSVSQETGSVSQELLKIRMKLEEKRKAIERKKHTQEIQQQKMRQRLGKAAFLHVVAKPKDDMSVPQTTMNNTANIPTRMSNSDPDIPVVPTTELPDSRMTASSGSPLKSPTHPKIPRPFSRDDIQQTIENVRKKWFNDEDLVAPRVADRSECESPEILRSQNDRGVRNVPYDDRSQEVGESRNEGQISSRPVFDRRSASIERITSLADPREQERYTSPRQGSASFDRRSVSVERPDPRQSSLPAHHANDRQGPIDRRSASVERGGLRSESVSPGRRDSNKTEIKTESYGQYNSSLDKLNQSLTDLQGEIMKLSLKQKRPDQASDNQDNDQGVDYHSRSRSRSPPRVLEVRHKNMPEKPMDNIAESRRSLNTQSSHSQGRSASEPRQIMPDPVPDSQVGNYQSHTLPRQPVYHPTQAPSPFMMQNQVTVAGPAGPIYANPNQYVPAPGHSGVPPTAQQYGSYILGPSPSHQMGHLPNAPYQHSPPQMYPPAGPMYPGQAYPAQQLVSPQSQQFSNIYQSPPHTQFQPPPHLAGTYTTSVHQNQVPFSSPTTQPLPFDPSNQYLYLQQQQQQQQQQQIVNAQNMIVNTQPVPASLSEIQTDTSDKSIRTVDGDDLVNPESGVLETQFNGDSGGFFISMNEGSPRRAKTKPQLSEKKSKSETLKEKTSEDAKQTNDTSRFESSVIADFAQKVAEQQKEEVPKSKPEPDKFSSVPQTVKASSEAVHVSSATPDKTVSDQSDTSAVGFLIGNDETTLDETTEEEMQKKKEKLEKMRQKRQEEQERKRLKLEQEINRKRETDRLRQEESERRKVEEKARRELIFKQYLEKKDEEEEKPKRPDKAKQKTRPKSMFVKAVPAADLTDGVGACASNEDLSTRTSAGPDAGNNSTASRGHRNKLAPSSRQNMRKAVSCNTLSQNGSMSASADSKTLAYGGLTHRRPPSPDLYRVRKGPRSNDGSEVGSAHGSDYSGPKLFVKPSFKSNRHIMINAISHCCLAGSVNTDNKNKVLEEIAKSNAKHFMILFRDASCGYRGLYDYDPETEECIKITGVGPRCISNDMIEKYFKYNSGGKSFSQVSSTKHLSVSIDAVSLQNSVWKPNKAPVKGYR